MVEIDRQEQRDQSPQPALGDTLCRFEGNGSLFVRGDGRTAVLDQILRLDLEGLDPTCSFNAIFNFSVTVTYAIQPEAGESDGSPVELCAEISGVAAAGSVAPYVARSQTGTTANIASPSYISLNSTNVVELGPFDESAATASGRERQHVAAAVGDTVQFNFHGIASASGMGVGSAFSTNTGHLSAFIGGCPDSKAPVSSPLGLLALVLALGLGGAYAARRAISPRA
ncbi:MAG TPA: hypothetical protein VGC36_01500 [Rhizomicrobium sp.]